MKILSLDIQNFLTLTEATVNLDSRGLMLVQGINGEDSSAMSNGAGKSSIADALCWALYGVTAREESGDQVVNDKAGKNTAVSVTIHDDGVLYTIARYRKHKVHKNSLQVTMDAGLGEQVLTLGTDKLTQDVVDKIIGCSLEVFTGSIYAGQEKMPDLPNMTDKFLKVLIEEAAGVTVLEEAYKLSRVKVQAAKGAYDTTRMVLAQNEAQATMLESQKVIAEQDAQMWGVQQADQITALETQIATRWQPEWEAADKAVDNADIPGLQRQIADIDAKLALVAQENVRLAQLNAASSAADGTVKVVEAEARRAIAEFQRAEQAITQVRHKIGCACRECGREITEAEVAAAEAAAVATRDASRVAAQAVALRLKDAQTAAQAASGALNAFRATLTDVSAETALRATLERELRAGLDLTAQRDNLGRAADADRATIARLQAQVSPFIARIAALEQEIVKVRAEVAKNETELGLRMTALDLETEASRIFSPAGVRARILDDVTPQLNDQTSKYLSVLSDGNISAEWSTLTVNKAGEVKEKFAIKVSSSISSKTFKGLSGGEKRKVRIATALALQDLVATRASKPIDLFVADEVDHALDAAGLERLMIVLREKAAERGTVLVISHNSLKDEIGQILVVERSATGQTTIHETIS